METINSAIIFKGYAADRLSFELKTPAAPTDDKQGAYFTPVYSREIKIDEEGECWLNLTAIIGQPEDTMPFTAQVSITGRFHVPDLAKAKEMMEVNGTAILFPYLRAVVAQLTAAANIPSVLLPTINLVEMFKAKEINRIEE